MRHGAHSTLTKLVSCEIQGGKKNLYLLCTVHGVYCICKEKSNHVLQEDLLVRGCMKKNRKDPMLKEIRLYIKVFAYSTALSG